MNSSTISSNNYMNKRKSLFCIFILFSLILISCGTSTGSRYQQDQGKLKKTDIDSSKSLENFDLTKYHSKINIKEITKPVDSTATDVWYSYNSSPNISDTAQTVVKTLPGYRVLVMTTDNLNEANDKRSEIYFKTDHAAVYVIFDPPFYKVEAGDFTDRSDAQILNFKLKQMGYSDVRVINETINKFK
jgi:hypothetical protein